MSICQPLHSSATDEDLEGGSRQVGYSVYSRGVPAPDHPLGVISTIDADDLSHICVICQEGILRGQRARTLACFHVFHEGCIAEWLEGSIRCPVDNHDVMELFRVSLIWDDIPRVCFHYV